MSNDTQKDMPSYIKYFYIVGSISLTCFILIKINFFVGPLLAAAIIAILLTQPTAKIEKLGIPRILSTAISVFLFLIGILLLIIFITVQLGFIATNPGLSVESISKMISQVQNQASNWSGIHIEKLSITNQSINNFLKSLTDYFPEALLGTASFITMFILFLVSLFFFLYYRSFFLSFIYKLFERKKHDQVQETLQKISEAVKNYIVGLFIVIFIVALLNSVGLLFLGISHAIFFGVVTAILTIIPYIGIMLGAVIVAFYALITSDSLWYPTGVLLIFSFVQFLEGNFITPNVIGSKVNINPYIAILGLFIGGILLGAVGAILAIPLLGIIKIICDVFQKLKPLSYIMGNPRKESASIQQTFFYLWLRGRLQIIKKFFSRKK